MTTIKKPFTAAGTAITYITVGALLDVWGVVWLVYLRGNDVERASLYYVCAGIIFSGLVLLLIGLGLGRIGRSARRAEMPPEPPAVVVHQVSDPARATAAPSSGSRPGKPANAVTESVTL